MDSHSGFGGEEISRAVGAIMDKEKFSVRSRELVESDDDLERFICTFQILEPCVEGALTREQT